MSSADIEALIEAPYGGYDDRRGDRKRRRSRSNSYERRQRRRERERRDEEREMERKRRVQEEEDRRRQEDESKRHEEDAELCERDKRTVFVSCLHPRVDDNILKDFFAKAGKVREIRMITDRKTGRSKGIAYVEFYDPNSVIGALALHNIELMGHPVQVKQSEADKNPPPSARPAEKKPAAPIISGAGARRLYVGNLHLKVTARDLESIFEELGPVVEVALQRDKETGKSLCYAHLRYKHGEDAKKALVQINGSELAGKRLKIGLISESTGNEGEVPTQDDESLPLNQRGRAILMSKLLGSGPSLALQAPPTNQPPIVNPAAAGLPSIPGGIAPTVVGTSSTPLGAGGMGGGGATPAIPVPALNITGIPQPAAASLGITTPGMPNPGAPAAGIPGMAPMGLPPGVPGGMPGGIPGMPPVQPVQPVQPVMPVQPPQSHHGALNQPTECIVLKNLFDPTKEQETDFDEDIKEDVCEECNKFGRVVHVFVDKVNPQGLMYLKFDSPIGAQTAHRTLNNRWFNHRMITVEFLSTEQYRQLFPAL